MNKKMKKTELTFDQVDTECNHFDHKSSQIGISVYSIIINKWDEYQSEYLRQKPYRQTKARDEKELQNQPANIVTRVTDRGEERREEEKRLEERREERKETDKQDSQNFTSSDSPSSLSLPSHKTINLEEFLVLLKACPDYPFDAKRDIQIYHLAAASYPQINLRRQLERKLLYWKENPGKVHHDPRSQLMDFFRTEEKTRFDHDQEGKV